MPDIEHSEALDSIVAEIQKGELFPKDYTLMLQTFINETEVNYETNRMALALAKQSIIKNSNSELKTEHVCVCHKCRIDKL